MVERLFDFLSDAAWVTIPMRLWVINDFFFSQILGGYTQVLEQVPCGNTLPLAVCLPQIVDERLNGFDPVDEVLDHDLGGNLSVLEGVDGHDVSPEGLSTEVIGHHDSLATSSRRTWRSC